MKLKIELPTDDICEKYLGGMNIPELAKEYGCSDSTITIRLRDNSVKIRTTAESKTLKLPIDEICEKYINGMSLPKLALIYKCSIPTIIKRLNNNGVKTRSISESKLGMVSGENNSNYMELPTNEICEKYLTGMTVVELTKEYDCSHPTIIKRLHDGDIKTRLPSERTLKHSEHLSASLQGISYDDWESFASEQLYCPLFNEKCRESNREKYNRRCFLTGLPEEENITSTGKKQKLSVHHVDMDKGQGCNGIKWKLVPLSIGWHNKTHNELWEARIIWLLDNVW